MKKQYDSSKGGRGRCHKPGARLNVPVYLDGDVRRFVERITEKKSTDVSTVVNELLKSDKP